MSVTRLSVTAIKGFGVQHPDELLLTVDGVPGDRAFFVVDEAGRLLSATRTPAFLPYWSSYDAASGVLTIGRDGTVLLSDPTTDGEPVRAHFFGDRYAAGHLVTGPWSGLLSDLAGQAVRLVRADDPLGGYDLARCSLVSESSVHALGAEQAGDPLDVRRFRMTLTVGGVPAFTEDSWTDAAVAVGESVVRVVGPVRRCAAVRRQPDGLESAVDPLRRIRDVRGVVTSAWGRGVHLGVYGEVLQAGVVRVGDAVRPRVTSSAG